ncbi:monofunctional biosynthetic peptidoglycan transglycosylase [Rhodobacteraceae bacterium]|nr:monofunctional biosynthetic peptidoglycan transglycosylase [Paracoccaceae bacterium]
MAKKTKPSPRKKATKPKRKLRLGAWIIRALVSFALAIIVLVGLYRLVPPPSTPYILAEGVRLGGIERSWVPMDQIAPVVARSVVAAEDANFCLHWGFDMSQLRAAIAQGGSRGASTLSQQTVKNLWLWQGRSWLRKALEGVMTPVVEAFWPKRRILEMYLNVAEFDTGVFGIEAAAQHHFGTSAANLSARQAALLSAVLPNPKERQAVNPSSATQRRAASIVDGAATIQRDGRADCFE